MTQPPRNYPLQWPAFRPRTPANDRRTGRFTHADRPIKIPDACERLLLEVDRLGGVDLVISTNVEPTIYGRPNANRSAPEDPGVALYFFQDGDPITLACDSFDEVAQNIAALAGHIDAVRRIERYGVQKAKETLQAFAALPASGPAWHQVLGVSENATASQIRAAHRERIRDNHPDKGGATAQAAEINAARDEGLKLAGEKA